MQPCNMADLCTTYYQSPVGWLEIHATTNRMASILFVEQQGEDSGEPVRLLAECVRQFDEYFAGARTEFTLPIGQSGTVFQQQVWQQLTTIRFGQTASYLEIAHKIGNKNSVRAVGMANGKNKLAILVPCHRVIGANDKLVGYEGGLWRKQWLLTHEAKYAHGVLTLF